MPTGIKIPSTVQDQVDDMTGMNQDGEPTLGVTPEAGAKYSDLSIALQGTGAPNHVRRDTHARDPLSKKFTKYGGKR